MKIPKKIQEAIVKCANYNSKATFYERIVHNWLEKHKLTEETCTHVIRNMDDSFIDSCQQSYDPYSFIKQLEELEDE